MPFIHIRVAKKLDDVQKEAIMRRVEERITLLPGKSKASLMIEVSDGHTMSLGTMDGDCAYVEVKTFGKVDQDAKKTFTEAVFADIALVSGVSDKRIYLTFSDFSDWGSNGTFK